MASTDQSSPPSDDLPDFSPLRHITPTIHPCGTIYNNGNSAPLSRPFHLLHCGHIVFIDSKDRRCGRNCLYAVTWADNYLSTANLSATDKTPNLPGPLPPLSTTQAHDSLHCETCYGIPCDRYKIMASNTRTLDIFHATPPIRRALALTRPVIKAVMGMGDERVAGMLCWPLRNRTRGRADIHARHYLRCGHEVLCTAGRPCALNCSDGVGCAGRATGQGNGLQDDAIVCGECVARTELVFKRYAQLVDN